MATPEECKAAGNAKLKAGDMEAAVAAYTAGLALDPDRTSSEATALLVNRALAHIKLSSFAACKDDCTEALRLHPGYGKAYYRRALAHEGLGALADAFKDVRELMRLEPANKEAVQLASKLKQKMEARAVQSDLSRPTAAVETLRTAAAGSDEQLQAVGKLSKIADDGGRSTELLHSGAVEALVAVLPPLGSVSTAADVAMPLVGLAVEALDRMGGKDEVDVLKAIAKDGETLSKVLMVVKAAANASSELGAGSADGGSAASATADGEKAAERVKNLLLTARRGLSLLASAAGSRSAVGSQTAQGQLVTSLLGLVRHGEESVGRAAQDGLVRIVDKDADAARTVLPQILKTLIFLLGDEESVGHRVALGVLAQLMGTPSEELKSKRPGDPEKDEDTAFTKQMAKACESVISPILRSDECEAEPHRSPIPARVPCSVHRPSRCIVRVRACVQERVGRARGGGTRRDGGARGEQGGGRVAAAAGVDLLGARRGVAGRRREPAKVARRDLRARGQRRAALSRQERRRADQELQGIPQVAQAARALPRVRRARQDVPHPPQAPRGHQPNRPAAHGHTRAARGQGAALGAPLGRRGPHVPNHAPRHEGAPD